MHGHGKYTFSDGCIYEGGYADGRKHGTGKLTYPDGEVDSGVWDRGQRVVEGAATPAVGGAVASGGRPGASSTKQ